MDENYRWTNQIVFFLSITERRGLYVRPRFDATVLKLSHPSHSGLARVAMVIMLRVP